MYGFYEECKRRYNVKMWRIFSDVFNCLPLAALIDDKILCMHGGLSPDLKSLEQLHKIPWPLEIPDTGLICDILWSDPSPDIVTWDDNEWGVSYVFGSNVVEQFLKENELDLICRAH